MALIEITGDGVNNELVNALKHLDPSIESYWSRETGSAIRLNTTEEALKQAIEELDEHGPLHFKLKY